MVPGARLTGANDAAQLPGARSRAAESLHTVTVWPLASALVAQCQGPVPLWQQGDEVIIEGGASFSGPFWSRQCLAV